MLIQQNMGAIYDGSQRLIAPVLNSTTATKNWEVDEEFILDGNLYKVTTAIPSGSQIIVSGSSANCELADTVTEQIVNITGRLVTATYPTTSIPTGELTTIATAPLEANHTYLVVFSHDWTGASSASNVITADRIRWTPSSGTGTTMAIIHDSDGMSGGGGGVSMSAIITTTKNGTIDGDTSQTSGATKTVSNVNFKVYRLL